MFDVMLDKRLDGAKLDGIASSKIVKLLSLRDHCIACVHWCLHIVYFGGRGNAQ